MEQKPHLVHWNLICVGKDKGGLGVTGEGLGDSTMLFYVNGISVLGRREGHFGEMSFVGSMGKRKEGGDLERLELPLG